MKLSLLCTENSLFFPSRYGIMSSSILWVIGDFYIHFWLQYWRRTIWFASSPEIVYPKLNKYVSSLYLRHLSHGQNSSFRSMRRKTDNILINLSSGPNQPLLPQVLLCRTEEASPIITPPSQTKKQNSVECVCVNLGFKFSCACGVCL